VLSTGEKTQMITGDGQSGTTRSKKRISSPRDTPREVTAREPKLPIKLRPIVRDQSADVL